MLINKIKEQLMAEKIRPPHLPPTSASSQQPLLVPPAPAESSQAVMSLPKLQQVPGLHPQAVPQPDVALHARPATSTVTGTVARGDARGEGGGSGCPGWAHQRSHQTFFHPATSPGVGRVTPPTGGSAGEPGQCRQLEESREEP